MQMVIFMKDNGLMIKPMEKERTLMLTVPITMVMGLMISSTDSEWNPGPTVQSMKVTT